MPNKDKPQMQNILDRMDKQQGPTVQHRELYSVFYDKPEWKRVFKKNVYIHIYHFAIQQKLT